MTKKELFKKIFKTHSVGIILTYVLFGLEILLSVINPYLLGKAVDGLIASKYNDLIIFTVVEIVYLFITVNRQKLDTKVYTKIYSSIVTKFLIRNHTKNDTSKLTARANLAEEIVNFFEYDLGNVLAVGSSIIGSIVMIAFYNVHVFVACMCLMVPISFISYKFGKKIKTVNTEFNDEYEKNVDIIAEGEKGKINNHYNKIMNIKINLSNIEAQNYGYLELLNIALIIITLLIVKSTGGDAVTTGTIIGVYNYVTRFSSSLHSIPHLLQRFTNLTDILTRLNIEDEDLLTT